MAYQKGSGFIGLQQYLNANQQAGQRMGEQVISSVQAAGMPVQEEIDTAANAFAGYARAGTPNEESAMELWGQGGIGGAARSGAIRYEGPGELKEVADIGALETKAKTAEEAARLGGTDAGRATILQQQYGRGYTGVGGRSLDAALAGRGGGGRLEQAVSHFGNLQKYLGGAVSTASGLAASGRQQAANITQRHIGDVAPPPPPTPYVMGEPRRNVIATPGTPPPPKPKKPTWFDNVGSRLFGGKY
jgi:hypothetical protein